MAQYRARVTLNDTPGFAIALTGPDGYQGTAWARYAPDIKPAAYSQIDTDLGAPGGVGIIFSIDVSTGGHHGDVGTQGPNQTGS